MTATPPPTLRRRSPPSKTATPLWGGQPARRAEDALPRDAELSLAFRGPVKKGRLFRSIVFKLFSRFCFWFHIYEWR